MSVENQLQKLADEFCKEKGLLPISVYLDGSRSYCNPFRRKINVVNEHDLKHELRHYHIFSKTKNIAYAFDNVVVWGASTAGMLIGYFQNNNYLFGLSAILSTGYWLGETYANLYKGNLKDLIINFAWLSFPLLPTLLQTIK